jgi:hypothetical protein
MSSSVINWRNHVLGLNCLRWSSFYWWLWCLLVLQRYLYSLLKIVRKSNTRHINIVNRVLALLICWMCQYILLTRLVNATSCLNLFLRNYEL